MVKIEVPEGWAAVAEPLRALVAELERAAAAGGAAPNLAGASARWERVRDAFLATARARIAAAAGPPASKR